MVSDFLGNLSFYPNWHHGFAKTSGKMLVAWRQWREADLPVRAHGYLYLGGKSASERRLSSWGCRLGCWFVQRQAEGEGAWPCVSPPRGLEGALLTWKEGNRTERIHEPEGGPSQFSSIKSFSCQLRETRLVAAE